jgi:hypothetical protein
VLALLARGPVRSLVYGLRLKKVKRGDWEAEFDEASAEVRAELPPKAQEVARAIVPSSALAVVEASPTGAVLEAWKQIEHEIEALARANEVPVSPMPTTLDGLVSRNVITPEARNSITGLRQLRNLAVHGPAGEVSANRAREFLAMAEAILWILRDTKPHGNRRMADQNDRPAHEAARGLERTFCTTHQPHASHEAVTVRSRATS